MKQKAVETTVHGIAQQLRAHYVIAHCGELNGKLQLEVADPGYESQAGSGLQKIKLRLGRGQYHPR